MTSSRDDHRPTASAAMLRRRAELMQRTRDFFTSRGFLEVDTPLLSHDTVIDRFIEPFAVPLNASDPKSPVMWLQTSPEFHMKRLLAAGEERVFQIARSFRREEAGDWHNGEFTMVEWYRTGDTYEAGRRLLSEFVCEMLDRDAAPALSYRDAFRQFADVDPFAASDDELRDACRAAGDESPSSDRDELLNYLLAMRVEPQLGRTGPQVFYDYPASQAALAQVRNDDPPVAERFELYCDGVELANGYHELLDAEVLRRRNRETNAKRQADGKSALPEASRLLDAMEAGLPACVGVALGFDRLLMLAAGAQSIAEVMPFPFDRA